MFGKGKGIRVIGRLRIAPPRGTKRTRSSSDDDIDKLIDSMKDDAPVGQTEVNYGEDHDDSFFEDANQTENSCLEKWKEGEAFKIESTLFVDGCSMGKIVLVDESWYPSGRIGDDMESFHEVDPESITLSTIGPNKGRNGKARPVTPKTKSLLVPDTPIVWISTHKKSNQH